MFCKHLIALSVALFAVCSALPAPVPDPKASHATIYTPGSYSYQQSYVEHSPAVVKTVVSEPLIATHVLPSAPILKTIAAPPTVLKYEAAPLVKAYEYPVYPVVKTASLVAAPHASVIYAAH